MDLRECLDVAGLKDDSDRLPSGAPTSSPSRRHTTGP